MNLDLITKALKEHLDEKGLHLYELKYSKGDSILHVCLDDSLDMNQVEEAGAYKVLPVSVKDVDMNALRTLGDDLKEKIGSGVVILASDMGGKVNLIVTATDDAVKQYIVVNLGDEFFGIDIMNIDNIVRMQTITRVPKSLDYFKGVINLRGEVVPVMSLRRKMGIEDDVITNASRIIIVKIEGQYSVGILVDSVKEVISLAESSIENIVRGVANDRQMYIKGIGKFNDELISLLNIDSIIGEILYYNQKIHGGMS